MCNCNRHNCNCKPPERYCPPCKPVDLKCVWYNGIPLAGLGITMGMNGEQILTQIDTRFLALQTQVNAIPTSGGSFTGTNIGTGEEIYAGSEEFKTLKAGANITLTSTATEITIVSSGASSGGGSKMFTVTGTSTFSIPALTEILTVFYEGTLLLPSDYTVTGTSVTINYSSGIVLEASDVITVLYN